MSTYQPEDLFTPAELARMSDRVEIRDNPYGGVLVWECTSTISADHIAAMLLEKRAQAAYDAVKNGLA